MWPGIHCHGCRLSRQTPEIAPIAPRLQRGARWDVAVPDHQGVRRTGVYLSTLENLARRAQTVANAIDPVLEQATFRGAGIGDQNRPARGRPGCGKAFLYLGRSLADVQWRGIGNAPGPGLYPPERSPAFGIAGLCQPAAQEPLALALPDPHGAAVGGRLPGRDCRAEVVFPDDR